MSETLTPTGFLSLWLFYFICHQHRIATDSPDADIQLSYDLDKLYAQLTKAARVEISGAEFVFVLNSD